MRTDELIARTRMAVFIGDATTAPDYSDAWVINELNDQQSTLFERTIVNSKQGYWMKMPQVSVTAGVQNYISPWRAVAGGLKGIDIAYDATLDWLPLPEVNDVDSWQFDPGVGQTGQVVRFTMRGDQIALLPTPDAQFYALRLKYYLRPSRLVTQQSSTLGGGTIRGRIDAWNPSTRVATVNALPFDMELAAPAAITSGQQKVDVVRAKGWHEVQLVSATQTISGVNITFGGTDDVSTIVLGDYVRVEEQTDWPALPDDFHRCLCDATAIKIATQLGDKLKVQLLSQELGADLERFQDLLSPRVKDTGGTDIVMPFGLYRGGRRTGVVKFP